jgi:hypothetical protein
VTTRQAGDPLAEPFMELARRIEIRCQEEQSSGPNITVED